MGIAFSASGPYELGAYLQHVSNVHIKTTNRGLAIPESLCLWGYPEWRSRPSMAIIAAGTRQKGPAICSRGRPGSLGCRS